MTQDLNATRAMWDERYGAQPFAYGTEPNVYFAEKLSALPPGRLLLPAEGEARNAAFALRQGWTVDAFDLSSEAQRKALTLCAGFEDALDYRVGDAIAMDYADESVDALAFVYAHFPSAVRAELYPKLLRAVRPGGHVIVEVFGQRQLTYQPHHASGGPARPGPALHRGRPAPAVRGLRRARAAGGRDPAARGHLPPGPGLGLSVLRDQALRRPT